MYLQGSAIKEGFVDRFRVHMLHQRILDWDVPKRWVQLRGIRACFFRMGKRLCICHGLLEIVDCMMLVEFRIDLHMM